MQLIKPVVVVDYGSFTKKDQKYGNIDELTDVLNKKKLEVYALIPADIDVKIPALDANIKGVIPYSLNNLVKFDKILYIDTIHTTRCDNKNNFFVISSNPNIIAYYENIGLTVCRINTGCNDLMTSKAIEINNIKKIGQLIK